METYREQLDKLDTYFENGKLHHSVMAINIFKFLYWIKIFLGKKNGYIDWISKGKDCQIMTDAFLVLNDVLNDVMEQMEILLKQNQINSFKELEKITKLIINNFDKPIRSNPNIIYDEDDDNNEELNCNLLHKFDNLIHIDNYLDENIVNG
jgi:hypothetical protein